MLGLFSARDEDMMAMYGSVDAIQAMQVALDTAVEHHTALSKCKKLFENVAAGDLSNGGGLYSVVGVGTRVQ
jgi:hypothetical protein